MSTDRSTLRQHVIQAFDAVATPHRSGHQMRYARRYVIQNRSGRTCEVMVEVSEKTPVNIWFEANGISKSRAKGLNLTFRPSAETYAPPSGSYGSHSGLQSMDRLHKEDAYKAAPETIAEFYNIFDAIRDGP
ncbi:MAG: hypothetical protein ACU0BS_13145 [Hasllibacter sp.]